MAEADAPGTGCLVWVLSEGLWTGEEVLKWPLTLFLPASDPS